MNLSNQVTLLGNLGNDVELKTVSGDKNLTKCSIATNEFYKKDGNPVQETQWHNLIAWGKTATMMKDHLKKGDRVLVQGKLTYSKYEDSNGKKHYYTEVQVNEFIRLTKPGVSAAS